MNCLLRPRIWSSFLASSGVPSTGSGQAPLATYRSGTPRNQSRGTAGRVARWHTHLCGLATAIHEISGLGLWKAQLARSVYNAMGIPWVSMTSSKTVITAQIDSFASLVGSEFHLDYQEANRINSDVVAAVPATILSIQPNKLGEFVLMAS